MKKIFKRILAFILPVIILIPCIVVFSEDTLPNTLYVGSTLVISEGVVTDSTSDSEVGWTYDKDKNILYLTDATITGATDSTIGAYGIYAEGNLEIRFSGTNSVISTAAYGETNGFGIHATGELVLGLIGDAGTGILNVETSLANSSNSYLVGIEAFGGFNITSGEIIVKSGDTINKTTIGINSGANSFVSGKAVLKVTTGDIESGIIATPSGIQLGSKMLTVSDSASVEVTSGGGPRTSIGIYGNLNVKDNAYVKAESNKETGESYGISGKITISDSAHVIAKSPYSATNTAEVNFSQSGYYWRLSESAEFVKSGTQNYTYDSSNTYIELKSHEHVFSSIYEYDANEHWKTCTADCPINGISENGAHSHNETTGECLCGHSIPFTIATQPDNLSVEYTYKTEPKLSVRVNTFGSENVSYQWYEGNNTETGTILAGANQSTYNVPTGKTTGEYSYYCVVTLGSHTETSSIATLTVNAKNISGGEFSGVDATYTYAGSVINPNYVVKVDGKTLTETTDYTVTYQKDGKEVSPLNASDDEYTIIIDGINNYTGEITKTFKINKATPDLGYVSVAVNTAVDDNTSYEDVELQRTNTDTPGELKLDETTMQANKNTYNYTFTPDDLINYEIVTGEVTINVKDSKEPTAQIKVGEKTWDKFTYEEAKTHELITKDNIEVVINAEDDQTGSGIIKVEYLLSGSLYDNPNVISDWTTLGSKAGEYKITIEDNMIVHVYVKVTDNDGNYTIVNTPILVKYEDVTDLEKDILFTKASNENVTVKVDFKDNTIKNIKDGEELIPTYEYEVTEDGIIFSAEYLDTFAASDEPYQFIVSYYPSGAIVDEFEMSMTTINLTVEKASPAYTIPTNLTGTYGDKLKSINLPSGFTWSNPEETLSAVGKKEYTVTYTPEDTDSYKVVKDIKVAVNVDAKSIANAKVTLDSSLTYTGKSQTQTIKNVILDGEEVTYKVNGNKATKVGSYVLTIEGTGNFSGTIKVTYKISPDTSKLDNLTEENVTIKDKEVIEQIKDSIENSNATEEEKKEYQDIIDKSEELLDKIEELEKIEEEKKEENNKDKENITSNNQNSNQSSKDDEDDEISIEEIEKELDKYTEETVKVSDKETIEEIIAAIDKQIANEKITEEDKIKLEQKKEEAEKLLNKITILEETETTIEDSIEEDTEKENSNSVFYLISLVFVGTVILIGTFIVKRNKRIAN